MDLMLFAKVTGDMDPGYGSTSKMLAESAVCLAKDKLPNKKWCFNTLSSNGRLSFNKTRKKCWFKI
ncbi:MAG: hypothetical protein ACJ0P4_08950 [Flavobacteriaceae bacterium]